jgi:hypothetical protein
MIVKQTTFPQNPVGIDLFHKEKRSKKEKNSPDGKVENAMKPRFPLSHRAHHKRREKETTRERTKPTKESGLSTASSM